MSYITTYVINQSNNYGIIGVRVCEGFYYFTELYVVL